MKLLITEDDATIREGICAYLSEFSYEIIEARDGREALSKFESNKIDLVILDIQIPFINGLDILRKIREKSNLPVLILTAFSDEEFKITAFSNLADGYIEKPFSLPVLKARIDALITKNYEKFEVFSYKDLEVNFSNFSAKINNTEAEISAKEIEVLKYLLLNEGRALTRKQILENVWKESENIPFDRVIDVYIKDLRKKFGLDCIKTIRNVGYKLERK
jgi:DNA-binding response regulator vncR